ncbi:MAG: cytochrome c [Granulosicoccus sp.]
MRLPRSIAFSVVFFGTLHSSSALSDGGFGEDMQPWEICALCHALDGNSHMAKFPKLAGQKPAYIEKQIRDFLSGKRTNDGGQMVAIVTEITETEIPAIAAWFASQSAPAPLDTLIDSQRGKEIYVSAGCGDCHSTSSTSEDAMLIPHLSAQHANYLAKQMRDFQAGNRLHLTSKHSSDPVAVLSLPDIEAVAQFLHGQLR